MNKRKIMTRVGIPFIVGAALVGGFAAASFTPHAAFWAGGNVAAAQHGQVAEAHVVDALWPGYCNDITFDLTNPNPVPVEITDLAQHGTITSSDSRLLDFLSYNVAARALDGERIGAGETRTFVLRDGVCLDGNVDSARMGEDFKVGVFASLNVIPGNEHVRAAN